MSKKHAHSNINVATALKTVTYCCALLFLGTASGNANSPVIGSEVLAASDNLPQSEDKPRIPNKNNLSAEADQTPPPTATSTGRSSKPPIAVNMDLSKPVEPAAPGGVAETDPKPGAEVAPDTGPRPPLLLLGTEVAAGTSTRLSWSPEHSFAGIAVPTPVLVVNGKKPGPVLCLTAAIHGDELNGIEIVRRVLYDLDAKKLAGTVIGVPIVNLQGFRRGSRYMPDRRDLNRIFPGNPRGSSTARIADSFFAEVISNCSALVDLHTGSFHRTNLPQLRADLKNPQVVKLTQGFGSTVVLHSAGAEGTLRRAASDAGIPAVTLEAGEPARVQAKAVSHGTKGVMTLLNELGMYKKITMWGHREPVYYRSTWVRAERGGVLFSDVALGEQVSDDQLLGTITDPITNVQSEIRATAPGRVLGMAVNQFVMPGFAAFRIGIETPDGEVPTSPALNDLPDEELAAVGPDGEAIPTDVAPGEHPLPDERDELEDSE